MTQNIGSDSQSFKGYCGIAEESSYGGGGVPTDYLDIVSDGFTGDNQPIYLNTIRGRDTYKSVAGAFNDEGGLDMPVTPESVGLLLKAAFGSASVTADTPEVGANQHIFTTDDFLPSLAVELGLGGVTAVRHVGVGVESLELSHSSDDRLGLSVDLPAKEPDGDVTPATPAYDDLRALVFHDSTITMDDADRTVDVRDVTMSLTNNLDQKIRGERTPTKMSVGQREVTFDVTLDFENENVMNKFWGSATATGPEKELAEVPFNATWVSPETIPGTSTQFSLDIDAPRCIVETHDAQLNENDLIAENVTLRALLDTGGSGYDIQATLVNGVATGY